MEIVLQTLLNALIASGLYGLLAVGLSLVFGVARIFNFAHGELYMVGAYTVWLLYAERHWPFFAAVALAGVIVGALGMILERGLFRPLRENPLGGFICAVGVVFILQVFVGQVWGVGLSKPVPTAYPQALHFFGADTSLQKLIILPASILLLGGLWIFLQRTRLGVALRASAQDAEAASVLGISLNRTAAIAMGMGSALAATAGGLMAPLSAVDPYMGAAVVWKAFVVIIVGGVGRLEGTIVAAILFGFLDSIITTVLDSTIANLVGLLLMLFILAVRPRGLLGRE